MTLRDNVFIKDLQNNDNTTGYWIYKIGKFKYYIPNDGYLLIIDTFYKDIEDSGKTITANATDGDKFKMFGKMTSNFKHTNASDVNKLNEVQFNNLKRIINTNNFSKDFTNDGGLKPDDEILRLINKINTDINNKTPATLPGPLPPGTTPSPNGDLSDIIEENMRMFLHNRIGTPLSEDEMKNINKQLPVSKFEEGKLYASKVNSSAYVWVMFKENSKTTAGNVVLFSRQNYNDSDPIIVIEQPGSNLKEYTLLHEVKQRYKPNEAKLTEEELIENYIIQ
jgi:hypothetical protein